MATNDLISTKPYEKNDISILYRHFQSREVTDTLNRFFRMRFIISNQFLEFQSLTGSLTFRQKKESSLVESPPLSRSYMKNLQRKVESKTFSMAILIDTESIDGKFMNHISYGLRKVLYRAKAIKSVTIESTLKQIDTKSLISISKKGLMHSKFVKEVEIRLRLPLTQPNTNKLVFHSEKQPAADQPITTVFLKIDRHSNNGTISLLSHKSLDRFKPNLTSISLKPMLSNSQKTCMDICNMLSDSLRLRTIRFDFASFSLQNLNLYDVFEHIADLPELSEVFLRVQSAITLNTNPRQLPCRLQSLEILVEDRTKCAETFSEFILGLVGINKNLSYLRISSKIPFGLGFAEVLCELLSTQTESIQHLSLECHLPQSCCRILALGFDRWTRLQSLSLSFSKQKLMAEEIGDFFDTISKKSKLAHLSIEFTKVIGNFSAWKRIFESLSHCSELKLLDLNFDSNQSFAEGSQFLIESVTKLQKADVTISACDCFLMDSHAEAFLTRIASSNPYQKLHLNLLENQIVNYRIRMELSALNSEYKTFLL